MRELLLEVYSKPPQTYSNIHTYIIPARRYTHTPHHIQQEYIAVGQRLEKNMHVVKGKVG